jgi:anti-sigma factor RsiW
MGENGDGRCIQVNVIGNRHMDPDEIERYSLGDLSEEKAAAFDEHLLLCGACRTNVEVWDAYVAAMRGAASQIRQKGIRAGRRNGSAAKTSAAGGQHA